MANLIANFPSCGPDVGFLFFPTFEVLLFYSSIRCEYTAAFVTSALFMNLFCYYFVN